MVQARSGPPPWIGGDMGASVSILPLGSSLLSFSGLGTARTVHSLKPRRPPLKLESGAGPRWVLPPEGQTHSRSPSPSPGVRNHREAEGGPRAAPGPAQ